MLKEKKHDWLANFSLGKPISESFLLPFVIALRGRLGEESKKSLHPVERTQYERVNLTDICLINQIGSHSPQMISHERIKDVTNG